jgi:hypothetical protein
MTDEPPLAFIVPMPSPPADVSDAVASVRIACAEWLPRSDQSDHPMEAHPMEARACDVLLARDTDFSLGVCIGLGAALFAVVVFDDSCPKSRQDILYLPGRPADCRWRVSPMSIAGALWMIIIGDVAWVALACLVRPRRPQERLPCQKEVATCQR